jgi:hypothetical protein
MPACLGFGNGRSLRRADYGPCFVEVRRCSGRAGRTSFASSVKIGRFRYRENIHHLNVEAKTWVIIPANAYQMSTTKSVVDRSVVTALEVDANPRGLTRH